MRFPAALLFLFHDRVKALTISTINTSCNFQILKMSTFTETGDDSHPPVQQRYHGRRGAQQATKPVTFTANGEELIQQRSGGRRARHPRAVTAAQPSRPSFFIAMCFRSGGALTEAFRSAQQQLTALCPEVTARGLIPEPKMHITLGLVHLDRRNRELVARVVDFLRTRCSSLPVRSLLFQGLGYFPNGDGEHKKRVAYLEPSHDESLQCLQEFSKIICDELNTVLDGVAGAEVRVQDVMHLTLWKDKPVLAAAITESLSIEPFSADVMSVELMEIGTTERDTGRYRSFGGATF